MQPSHARFVESSRTITNTSRDMRAFCSYESFVCLLAVARISYSLPRSLTSSSPTMNETALFLRYENERLGKQQRARLPVVLIGGFLGAGKTVREPIDRSLARSLIRMNLMSLAGVDSVEAHPAQPTALASGRARERLRRTQHRLGSRAPLGHMGSVFLSPRQCRGSLERLYVREARLQLSCTPPDGVGIGAGICCSLHQGFRDALYSMTMCGDDETYVLIDWLID